MNRSFLKLVLFLLVFVSASSVFAQAQGKISGTVLNASKRSVQFATLYNLNKKTSCITNEFGEFAIVAELGDELRIQHVNCKTKDIKLEKDNVAIILEEKQIKLEEVVVSPKHAFDLFNTACTNTWKLFKKNNSSRAYCRVVRKTNNYIAQTADLDLDIVQKKYKSFNKGEQVKAYKAQERMVKKGTEKYGIPQLELTFLYPHVQQIYWVELPNKFNYYKIDEEEFIRLSLMNKKEYHYHVAIEVLIHRNDSSLHSFAIAKRNLTTFSIGSAGIEKRSSEEYDDYLLEETNHFMKYGYEDGFAYLREYYQDVSICENKIHENRIQLRQHLHTYDNGASKPTRRKDRRKIYKNSYNPLKTISRYENEFWKNYDLNKVDYDFEQLARLAGRADDKVLVKTKDADEPDLNEKESEAEQNVARYTMENRTEMLLEIAQKNKVTTDDIMFQPYSLKKGRPVYSDKKYGIQDMLVNIESSEILNNIMQVFYSNKALVKTKYGCVNFTCTKNDECLVFPFPGISEDVKVMGFAVYIRKAQ